MDGWLTVDDLAPLAKGRRAGTWDIGEDIARDGWGEAHRIELLIRPGTYSLLADGNRRIDYLERTGRGGLLVPVAVRVLQRSRKIN